MQTGTGLRSDHAKWLFKKQISIVISVEEETKESRCYSKVMPYRRWVDGVNLSSPSFYQTIQIMGIHFSFSQTCEGRTALWEE